MPWSLDVVSRKIGRNEMKGKDRRQVLHDKQEILQFEVEEK